MHSFKILFLSFLVVSSTFAQDAEDFDDTVYDDITPKHQFTMLLGLPNGTTNKPFSSIMQGVVKASPYYQFTLPNDIAIGIGANYDYFKINQVRIAQKNRGGQHNVGGFVKVGYEKFHAMRFGTEYSVKVGYNSSIIISDSNKTVNNGNVVMNGIYVEPMASVILTADEWSSYRFFVSYSFMSNGFSPQSFGNASNMGYDPNEFLRRTQFLTVGFGYTYYFKQYK